VDEDKTTANFLSGMSGDPESIYELCADLLLTRKLAAGGRA